MRKTGLIFIASQKNKQPNTIDLKNQRIWRMRFAHKEILKHDMNKIIGLLRYIAVAALAVILSSASPAQNTLYTNNWNDPSSFNISGGYIISNAWEVHNDSAVFTTTVFTIPKHKTNFDVELNADAVGKMTSDDKVYCFVYIDDIAGDSFILNGNNPENLRRIQNIKAYSEARIYIKVCVVSSGTDRSWVIKTGNLVAALPLNTDNPVTANYNGRVVQLNWNCITTDDSNYFIVERSADNTIFYQVGLVKASDNNTFSIIDHETKAGTNFYRVKLKTFHNKMLSVGNTVTINADAELVNR